MFQLYVSVDLNLNFSACCLVRFQYKNHLLWFGKHCFGLNYLV